MRKFSCESRRIARILAARDLLKGFLPQDFPDYGLVIHDNWLGLKEYYRKSLELNGEDKSRAESAYLIYCAEMNLVHVHPAVGGGTTRNVCWYLLHELGHLYALRTYGEDD